MRLALAFGFLMVLAAPSLAGAQSVKVTADTREIYAGLPFALLVEASGFDEEPEPTAPEIEIAGASVNYIGASPRVVRSTSIVNGRRTDRVDVTFVFRYQVTVEKAGTYKIPALEVVQGKKKAHGPQRTFSAKAVDRTNEMAIRVVLPERPVWLGEAFEVYIDWYLNADPSRPSFGIPLFVASDWASVKPVEAATRRRQAVTFSSSKGDLELPYSQEKAQLDGKSFTRLRFRALVTPLKAGTLDLAPARVVSALEVGVGRDRFGFPVARNEIFEAVGLARSLEIKPLPQTGRPAGFKNAVGTGFSLDVQASRTVVRVGDPIELTITVKSESRLTGMALPDLNVLLDPNHFSVGDDEPVGEVSDDGTTKVFQVTAQLKSSDVREVPPLELAYFNPKTGTYGAARSQPIALQVAGSAMVGAAQVTRSAGDRAGTSSGEGSVSLVGANLALSVPSDTLTRARSVSSITWLLGLLYLLPVAFLAFMVWRRRTAGTRAADGALRKRTNRLDRALVAAGGAAGKDAAIELAAALRSLKKERGSAPAEFDSVIAELDAQAYNPRGGSLPLEQRLIDRCKKVGASMLTVALLLVGLPALASGASSESGDLSEARAVYQKAVGEGDGEESRATFARAASGFAAAVSEHRNRPELLVDWGNASLGARDLGSAVLAYRRALYLDGGNERARSNLAWARANLPSWAPKPSDSGALRSLMFWRDWSLIRRHLVAAIAFAVAMLLLVPRGTRRPIWMTLAAMALFVVTLLVLLTVIIEPDRSADAVVLREAETLRAADSPGAASVIARPLPAGLEVVVLETRERWNHVELADGKRGWLPRAAIEMVVSP